MKKEITESKATESQKILLKSDWLAGTREKDFVKRNRKGAIEVILPAESAYSEYFAGKPDMTDACKALTNAREIAQNIINVTSEHPVTVKVGGNSSFTNGKIVNIATNHFDDNTISMGQKIDILTGFAVHEAAHLNYSDFDAREDFLKGMKVLTRKLAECLQNIIEDERIEQITGESMPGMMDFLAQTKAYIFGQYLERTQNTKNAPQLDKITRFINAVVKMIRYPSVLGNEEIDEFCNELLKTRNILTPYPSTTKDVERATLKIIDIVKDLVEEQEKEQQNKNQDQKQNGQQNDKSNNGDQTGQPEDNKGNGQNSESQKENSGGQDSSGNAQGDKQSDKKNKKENRNSLTEKALDSDGMRNLLDNLVEMMDASNGKNRSQGIADSDFDIINGDVERDGGMLLKYPENNKNLYQLGMSQVNRYIPAMKKALTCRTMDKRTTLRGLNSGHLDTNKLVSMKMGNNSIFNRKHKTSCESVCICTLIDESGSMNDFRQTAARNTAILINEAVKTLEKIQTFTYGFGGSELRIYKENKKTGKYALGSTKASGGTPTAQAMQIAAKRIRKYTQDKCLMLIITDGEPDSSAAVKKIQKIVTAQGFIPIGVDITGNYKMESLFTNYVKATELSTLPQDLGKLVKKTLYRELENKSK